MTVRIRAVILGPSSSGRGPANASPDQIIGELIIDGMVRRLRSSDACSGRSAAAQAPTPAASFYRLRSSSRRHCTRAISSTANACRTSQTGSSRADSGQGSRPRASLGLALARERQDDVAAALARPAQEAQRRSEPDSEQIDYLWRSASHWPQHRSVHEPQRHPQSLRHGAKPL